MTALWASFSDLRKGTEACLGDSDSLDSFSKGVGQLDISSAGGASLTDCRGRQGDLLVLDGFLLGSLFLCLARSEDFLAAAEELRLEVRPLDGWRLGFSPDSFTDCLTPLDLTDGVGLVLELCGALAARLRVPGPFANFAAVLPLVVTGGLLFSPRRVEGGLLSRALDSG